MVFKVSGGITLKSVGEWFHLLHLCSPKCLLKLWPVYPTYCIFISFKALVTLNHISEVVRNVIVLSMNFALIWLITESVIWSGFLAMCG